MIPDFSIVTAATPDYMKKLRYALPTWVHKTQFKGRKLYLFHHGFSNPEKELKWIGEYFPNVQFIEWQMEKYDTQRELMLSCFVLGSHLIEEEYFCKMDADAFFTDSQDVFCEDDFKYDLFSHSWSYTKPGWWIDYLDAWVSGKKHKSRADTGRRGAKRIQSICCLHKTKFVQTCADAAGSRLPIPSHDTYLWYMAEHFEDCTWGSRKLYKHGVGHNSKFKGLRENICANETAWNPYLNKELLKNVQVHITNACNIGCNNCDRVCGIAPDPSSMFGPQISQFVQESIDGGHRFNRIDIIGGEPMLYPDLAGLYYELERYRRWHGGRLKIRLTTNGTVHKDKLTEIPDWIQVRNSAKDCENKEYDFETFNVAPIDSGCAGADALACSIPWRCGIALTRNGYYLCGAGSAVARVFGLDLGIRNLHEVTPEALKAQRVQLCQFCGHSRSIAKREKGQQTSPAWRDALERYSAAKPVFPLYGSTPDDGSGV